MGDLRAAYLASDAFVNTTRDFMLANNLTEFRMCDVATLAPGGTVIQGFVPCPWPYHGVGTYADPAAACALGQSADAVVGSIIAMAIVWPFHFWSIYQTIKRHAKKIRAKGPQGTNTFASTSRRLAANQRH